MILGEEVEEEEERSEVGKSEEETIEVKKDFVDEVADSEEGESNLLCLILNR